MGGSLSRYTRLRVTLRSVPGNTALSRARRGGAQNGCIFLEMGGRFLSVSGEVTCGGWHVCTCVYVCVCVCVHCILRSETTRLKKEGDVPAVVALTCK